VAGSKCGCCQRIFSGIEFSACNTCTASRLQALSEAWNELDRVSDEVEAYVVRRAKSSCLGEAISFFLSVEHVWPE